ncbi:MAG: glycosyltransferase [Vicinamibacteria bacterium]
MTRAPFSDLAAKVVEDEVPRPSPATPPSSAPDYRILFVHNGRTRFIDLDRDLLASRHRVTELQLASKRMHLIRVVREVWSHDLVFGWFASWHTFFPMLAARILGKPSVLVIGGYDLANLPEIGYGHQRGGIKKHVSRRTMKLASRLVTNSCFSRREAIGNAGIEGARVSVVYHGLPDEVGSLPRTPRSPMALTVGNVDRANLSRKGIETFVRAAAHLPEIEFVVAGRWKDDAIRHLEDIASKNVAFKSRVTEEELRALYSHASVYVQPSRHEGFGMSVAEAMLAGCVPVVTRAGALPEVVGDQGIYVDAEPRAVATAVSRALSWNDEARHAIRQRILDRFPVERRRFELEALVSELKASRTS